MFCVYILYSEVSNRYYIGQTNNFKSRLERHNKGREESTKPYVPWSSVCQILKDTRQEAMLLEKKLKNLSTPDLKKFIEKYGMPSDT